MSKAKTENVPSNEIEVEKSAPLSELVETRRFLGREFLAWMWFESELFDTRFAIEGFGDCELWLERQLALETYGEREAEKSRLTGEAPSGRPEAREALRQGKLPTKAKIVVRRGEQDFAWMFDADVLGLSGVKIPALVKGDGEEAFYERMQLIEELEGAIESLYRAFLLLRLDAAWTRSVKPAMGAWMREEDDHQALVDYRTLRARQGISATELIANDAGRAPRKSTTKDRVGKNKVKRPAS